MQGWNGVPIFVATVAVTPNVLGVLVVTYEALAAVCLFSPFADEFYFHRYLYYRSRPSGAVCRI